MILRPRQALFVERSLSALDIHGNTLGVAPTGTGKTIILSAVAGKKLEGGAGKACVLAHRDELTSQNRDKFKSAWVCWRRLMLLASSHMVFSSKRRSSRQSGF